MGLFQSNTPGPSNLSIPNEIADILQIIRSKIDGTTDINGTQFDMRDELTTYLETCINALRKLDYSCLKELKIDFLPTSTFQELSMNNAWGEEYIRLSSRFDELYSSIK